MVKIYEIIGHLGDIVGKGYKASLGGIPNKENDNGNVYTGKYDPSQDRLLLAGNSR
jgi:hypothetical protein